MAWQLGHLHENLLTLCFTFHWIKLYIEYCLAILAISTPLHCTQWSHVRSLVRPCFGRHLRVSSSLRFLSKLTSFFSPHISSFALQRRYSSEDILLWQHFKVSLHIWLMAQVPSGLVPECYLVFLYQWNRKWGSRKFPKSHNWTWTSLPCLPSIDLTSLC